MNKATMRRRTGKKYMSSGKTNKSKIVVLGAISLFIVTLVVLCVWLKFRPTLEKAEKLIVQGSITDGVDMLTKIADSGNIAACKQLGLFYKENTRGYTDYEKATKYLELAANSGDTQAQISVAKLYVDNHANDQQYRVALGYLTPFEQSSNAEALGILGYMYYGGHGTDVDYVKAYQLLKKTSGLGNREYDYLLGIMSYSGEGGTKDTDLAEKYLASVPIGKSDDADRILGKIHYQNKEFQKAFRRLNSCDVNDDPEASLYLGKLLYDGIGVNDDYATAEKYLLNAKKHGFTEADLPLGMMYYYGKIGGESDYKKAYLYLKSAANAEFSESYRFLGKMLYEGLGTEKDIRQAVEYLSKAIQSGSDIESHSLLGQIYYYGNGVEVNYPAAALHLGFAAERENITAQILMAYLHYYGHGVKQDHKKTLQYLTKGVYDNIPSALALRGRMYYYGDGGEWNKDKALIMLRKAESMGNEEAALLLNQNKTYEAEKKASLEARNAAAQEIETAKKLTRESNATHQSPSKTLEYESSNNSFKDEMIGHVFIGEVNLYHQNMSSLHVISDKDSKLIASYTTQFHQLRRECDRLSNYNGPRRNERELINDLNRIKYLRRQMKEVGMKARIALYNGLPGKAYLGSEKDLFATRIGLIDDAINSFYNVMWNNPTKSNLDDEIALNLLGMREIILCTIMIPTTLEFWKEVQYISEVVQRGKFHELKQFVSKNMAYRADLLK